MEIEFNIPKYRAKKIDSEEHVIGNLMKVLHNQKDYFAIRDDDFYSEYRIDPSTLAINFPDMIDSEKNPIFASLSEDGKGGDIGQCFDYGENKYIFVYNSSTFEFGIKLIIEEDTDKDCWDYECLKDECLEIFNIIGIQK